MATIVKMFFEKVLYCIWRFYWFIFNGNLADGSGSACKLAEIIAEVFAKVNGSYRISDWRTGKSKTLRISDWRTNQKSGE
jgi:hypothetical protein